MTERDPKWPYESEHWRKVRDKAEKTAFSRAEKLGIAKEITSPEDREDFRHGVELGVQVMVEGYREAQDKAVSALKDAMLKGNDDMLRKLGLKK
jgi:hypothetical protein